jgi:hypothetical protein
MQRLFLLTVVAAFFLSSCGSPAPVSSFYQEHKGKEGVRNMTIPGWLLYIGTGLAYNMVHEEEARMALRFGKKVKRLQFMIAEDHNPISSADIDAFIHRIRQDDFEDLIYVRDEHTRVNVFVREKNAKLKHLIFLINDQSDFVFLNIRSNIKIQDIVDLVNYYMEKEGWSKEEKKKKDEEKPQV